MGNLFIACSYLAVVCTFPLSLLLCFKVKCPSWLIDLICLFAACLRSLFADPDLCVSLIASHLSQVVQEYERAVIFRLGKRGVKGQLLLTTALFVLQVNWWATAPKVSGLDCTRRCLSAGLRALERRVHHSSIAFTFVQGPGLFFILPCIDDYSVVDLRTITFDVPPQEVCIRLFVCID